MLLALIHSRLIMPSRQYQYEETLTDELSATARGKKSEHYDTIREKGSFHGEKMCLQEGSSPVQRNLRL